VVRLCRWGGVTEHGEVEMLEKQELKVKSKFFR
jgi:hypothetical protein